MAQEEEKGLGVGKKARKACNSNSQLKNSLRDCQKWLSDHERPEKMTIKKESSGVGDKEAHDLRGRSLKSVRVVHKEGGGGRAGSAGAVSSIPAVTGRKQGEYTVVSHTVR